jgi:hypothetical protein
METEEAALVVARTAGEQVARPLPEPRGALLGACGRRESSGAAKGGTYNHRP